MDLTGKRILVTGATGFLGRHVVPLLDAAGARILGFTSSNDLTNQETASEMLSRAKPQVVIHLAAVVGGIGFNQSRPAECIYDNLMMNLNVLHASLRAGVEKFVGVGSVCAYPKYAPQPMREHHLWTGYPEETNAPYGVSKLALLEASQAYRKQYGLNAIHVIPTNLYGPGDNFADESSHVIPALIKRFCRAVDEGAEEVTIWGTGNASRAFLHVQDCAEGIVAATADYDSTEPVNLGPSETWAIFHLAQRIADMTGFRGRIAFDESKPDGQPRRCVNADRAKEAFGWHPRVKFDDGLAATVAWWREKCAQEAANAA